VTIGPGIPGSTLEAFAEGFACGQAGILTVTIDDGDGNNVLPQTTANIIEIECGDDGYAVYRYLGVFPSDPALSPYVITWEGASATDPLIDTTASEEILVSTDAPAPVSGAGPCSNWIEGADIAECCGNVVYDSDTAEDLESAAEQASQLLFELSGRRYAGLCGPQTVRPCRDNCSCWPGVQWLDYASGGSRLLWTGTTWNFNDSECGCGCLSRVKLSGYPVQAIAQVKIDGAVVAPSSYRLDEHRYLTRVDGAFWPACSNLAAADDQPGTFSVSYYFGDSPPAAGVRAAEQLGCEIYKACVGQECALPVGVSRYTRQGITVEKMAFTAWAYQRPARGLLSGWRTGMALVDAFLAGYNPDGLKRRPVFWAPGRRYARPVGP